jgi:hypothetical protein
LHLKVIDMEKTYWLRRKREAMTAARIATTSESRLIHYELAGRYSIRAAHVPERAAPSPAILMLRGCAR